MRSARVSAEKSSIAHVTFLNFAHAANAEHSIFYLLDIPLLSDTEPFLLFLDKNRLLSMF